MSQQTNNQINIRSLLTAVQPTGTGTLFYVTFSLVVIVAQNLASVKQHFEVGNVSLNPLGYVFNWLVRLLGTGRSNELAEIIFWSVIGLVIYVFVVAGAHSLDEFIHDVKEVNYVHPARTDPAVAVKGFLKRLAFHLICLLLLIYYVVFLVEEVFGGRLQSWINRNHWLGLHNSVTLLILFLVEIIALHAATIILRLLFLRRRLLG